VLYVEVDQVIENLDVAHAYPRVGHQTLPDQVNVLAHIYGNALCAHVSLSSVGVESFPRPELYLRLSSSIELSKDSHVENVWPFSHRLIRLTCKESCVVIMTFMGALQVGQFISSLHSVID
jgi:hypothetical protein